MIRQRLWDSIRQLKRFAIRDLARDAHVAYVSATAYVRRLERAGYLKRAGTAPRQAPSFGGAPMENGHRKVIYQLARDIGVEAPRLDATGAPVLRGAMRDQLWRSMKMIGEFTCRELAVAATTEKVRVRLSHARHYVYFLDRAGYLGHVGKVGNAQLYRLAKNTGGAAPVVEKLPAVFDPNLGKVVWSGAPQ